MRPRSPPTAEHATIVRLGLGKIEVKNPGLVPVRGAKSFASRRVRSAECTALGSLTYIAPTTSLTISYPTKTTVAQQAAAKKTRVAVTRHASASGPSPVIEMLLRLCGFFIWRRLADGTGIRAGEALFESLIKHFVELTFFLWRLGFCVAHAALLRVTRDSSRPTFWSLAARAALL
jgi:hypothetical protein